MKGTSAKSREAIGAKGIVPVSPKSMYRLAHYLEMEEVQKLAIVKIVSQIKPSNAASFLKQDIAVTYPAVSVSRIPTSILTVSCTGLQGDLVTYHQ